MHSARSLQFVDTLRFSVLSHVASTASAQLLCCVIEILVLSCGVRPSEQFRSLAQHERTF